MAESIELKDIKIAVPDTDTQGWWLRQEQMTDLQIAYHDAKMALNIAEREEENEIAFIDALKQIRTAQDALLDFLIGYVESPDNPEDARRAFKMLSENQFQKVMERIREGSGKSENPTSQDGNGNE